MLWSFEILNKNDVFSFLTFFFFLNDILKIVVELVKIRRKKLHMLFSF